MQQYIRDRILPTVQKPARYMGNEWNIVKKSWEDVKVKMAFAFPDVYEVGMSHLGLQILYGLVNEQPDFLLERVFAPWVDMEERLRKKEIPLFSLESYHPLKDFHVIGFTLQYEMSYTNILNMLNMAQLPLLSEERPHGPLVIGGGPCAVNPEPLAPFFDCFLLGDSEEMLLEVLEVVGKYVEGEGKVRKEPLLKELAGIQGVYVPSFYRVQYREDGTVDNVTPVNEAAPERVKRRVLDDLDRSYFPVKPIVPYTEVVHDRMMLEVMRGCTRGCRFCQAGMVYRPVRERRMETLLKQAEELVAHTGHEEISLTSLSTADYSCVRPLISTLLDTYQDRGINVALPSLRVDAFSVDLAREVQKVRKSGLTFAPEAGSQRLRDVINKNVREEDLLSAVTGAFKAGWTGIKLYFMIGLPTETEGDLLEIARLAKEVLAIGRRELKEQGKKAKPTVTVSVSSFVPKAHTPFQFEPQDDRQVLKEKQELLARHLREKGLKFKWHNREMSFLEAVFARGSRKLAGTILAAWKNGCRFDSWEEHFNFDRWQAAFEQTGVNPDFFANRRVDYDEVLPWDHIDVGVSKRYLIKEHRRAIEESTTSDCRWDGCTGCAICQRFGVDNRLWGERHATD
ncbi:MAG: TIGR03960 family B12-binding radical SAM protein [Thermoanaerobacteraceae bacterium]|nr:TIGR03960 family B12-binding radical SAM protein [Thermoanaerobacteraceae bacterium]